ncbi:MAG: OOP family OmpA-OmpF porin [Saprospiraceae bacterium]|jgi:OOP family OmpA-OmpF porin|tara:strand:+ start:382 stop:1830 length:1449 start_codon:yes stop_codon:yes gene_type:complete
MSINLLDMLKDQVSGPLAKQASEFLGESEENVTSALGGIFPAILGSVIDKSSKPAEASGLMDMIGGLDMNMLGDIGGLFGGGASSVNGLLNSGGGIVESLLGDKMGGIASMISKLSGIKSGSTSSLMKMAAPFLMGIIGKQIKGKGLGFLTDMLMGQKESVAAALPSGMDNLLGLNFAGMGDSLRGAAASVTGAAGATVSGLYDTANNAAGAATGAIAAGADATRGAVASVASASGNVAGAAGDAAKSGLGWIKWALPILLIGGLAWWFITGQSPKDAVGDAGETIENMADKTGDVAKDLAGSITGAAENAAASSGDAMNSASRSVSNFAKGAFATINEAGKTALDKITFAANSAGSQMMEFIDGGFNGDGKVTFTNLTFTSGSDKIYGDSGVEIDNLAAILNAYPDVKINVAGYTDNTGDSAANKTLSENRAKSVKQRLMDAGIAPSRVATQGFGAANPVATNDTKEGQAQNRRIEVTIAK